MFSPLMKTQNTTDRHQKQDCLGDVVTWKATRDVIGLVHATPKYGISNDDVVDLPRPTASGRNDRSLFWISLFVQQI